MSEFIVSYTDAGGRFGEVSTTDEAEAERAFHRVVMEGARDAQMAWLGDDESGDDDQIILIHPPLDDGL